MTLQTKGFVNERQRNRKFTKHGADFGASNAQEYARYADEFLGGIAPDGVLECPRSEGDKLRFDPRTNAYGVLDAGGVIRTFFKPVPCSSIRDVSLRTIAIESGMCHGHATNLLYFQSECRRIYGD
jgi:hypothetical protein